MGTGALKRAAKQIGMKAGARACIVTVIYDTEAKAEAWGSSPTDQTVGEIMAIEGLTAIARSMRAAGDAATATKGKNSTLKVSR